MSRGAIRPHSLSSRKACEAGSECHCTVNPVIGDTIAESCSWYRHTCGAQLMRHTLLIVLTLSITPLFRCLNCLSFSGLGIWSNFSFYHQGLKEKASSKNLLMSSDQSETANFSV